MARKTNKKNIRLQDLAEKLNTSASTVSRALNDHPLISAETKKKVLDAALELGYQPAIPDLMSDSEINCIAFVVPDIQEESYQQIWSSVNKYFHAKNHIVLCSETKGDPKIEKEYFKQLDRLKVNGIIYVAHQNSNESLRYIVNRSFPVVIIHNDELLPAASHIVLDIYQSLGKSLDHLYQNNAKSVAVIANNSDNHLIKQIETLLPELTKENGVQYKKESSLQSNMDMDPFMHLMVDKYFINEVAMPDALLFSSHELAVKFQNLIKTHQKEVPLLISIGKDKFSSLAKPKISYIELNSGKMGEEAAEMLDSQILKKENPNTRIIKSGLVIKGSTLKF